MWLLIAGASLRAFTLEEAASAPPAPEPAPEPATPEPAAPAPPRFRIVDAPAVPGGWQVLGPSDLTVDSATLAAALDDADALLRLRRDRTRALVQDLTAVGMGLGAATGGVLLVTQAGPPESTGVRPDPLGYADWSDWRADTDAWEAQMDRADRRDERIWGGVTLLTGAVLAGALVPITGQEARLRAEHPARLWRRATLVERFTPTASVSPVRVQLAWVLP